MGTLWGGDGGKKVPSRRGGAGTGDGAGITGAGAGARDGIPAPLPSLASSHLRLP